MIRHITLASLIASVFVLFAGQQVNAQEFFASPQMMARNYAPAVIQDYVSSPYYLRYGHSAAAWRYYVTAHGNVLNAQARQIQEVTKSIALENVELEMSARRSVKSFQYEAKQQRIADFQDKAAQRRAAYERLKAKKAAERSEASLASN